MGHPDLANSSQTSVVGALALRPPHPASARCGSLDKAQGQLATVKVSADSDGLPAAPVRYAIAGANPGTGAVTTAADGTATIRWAGANLGADTLTAFIDTNGNGVRDADEPQQTVNAALRPPPPPVPGKSVVVKVVSGTVTIKYPPGYSRARGAAAAGFVRSRAPPTSPSARSWTPARAGSR